MRPSAAFMAGAGSAAIIAIGWQMGANAIAAQSGGATAAPSSSSSATPSSSSSATPSASGSSSASASAKPAGINGTFTGKDIYEPEFGGDVQVAVTFKNGVITAVNTVACNATDRRDQACPMLQQEAIAAKSANISVIGGATYTSNAYIQSLQSALDAAGYKG